MTKETYKKEQTQEKKSRNLFDAGARFLFPPRLIALLADEIAKTMIQRLPNILPTPRKRSAKPKTKKIEYALFLDTSAIIDGRIFDVIHTGLLNGILVVPESILFELKHIADSQDAVRRERGRKGLSLLEQVKKSKMMKVLALEEEMTFQKNGKLSTEVDERLIKLAKQYRGKIVTCDYNLEKKASIQNVRAINVNLLANSLKVTAVPGEALHIRIQHLGKDVTQGVGYLDDGTMIVVEGASLDIAKTLDVVVSRVIQTATGRILFAKKIS